MRKSLSYYFTCLIVILLIILISLAYLSYGNTYYSLAEIYNIFIDQRTKGYFTIMILKWPQIIVGVTAGICFGIGGNIFQRLLHNPLASPDVLGISASASFGAMLGILIFQISGFPLSLMALASAILGALAIMYLGRGSYMRLILSGIAMSLMFNALISWLQVLGNEYNLASAMRFLTGSLNDVSLGDGIALFILIVFALVILKIYEKDFEVLKLGDELPVLLGLHKEHKQTLFLAIAVILVACATAICGPIASIAFLSGPIASRLSTDYKSNMILSGLIGAFLVVGSQFLTTLLPYRYPVGVVTALIGAPYLLFLLVFMKGESS